MYKLAIDDIVEVPVKFTLKNGSVNKLFAFALQTTRLDQDAITSRLEEHGNKFAPFLKEVVTGWSGQRLILTADDQPADFGPETFDAMLGAAGVSSVIFAAYLRECGAKEKN